MTAVALAAACGGAAQTQGYVPPVGLHTLNPGDWPAHYPFADETEAAVAASEVHHVRYIDSRVRLVEVAYFPGVKGNMHGHPYPSVFAIDAPVPKASNTAFDPARNMVSVLSAPIDNVSWPVCRAASPQGLHHESNEDSFPHHFYRLEFLRLGGTVGTALKGQRLLYEDDHIQLEEVVLPPGVGETASRKPEPSVLAFDTAPPAMPTGAHPSPTLTGFETLRCATTAAAASSALRNSGATPVHFYRIAFKRIDGDGIKDHWREWYPWMATLKDAYDRQPYPPNF